MAELELLDEEGHPIPTRKGDPRKVALASVVKAHTSVDNEWIPQRLKMRHNRSVSRLIRQGNDSPEIKKLCSKLLKILPCEDCLTELRRDSFASIIAKKEIFTPVLFDERSLSS